jgi:hypothetical protein
MGSLNRLLHPNLTTLNLLVTPVITEVPACVSDVIGRSVTCDAYDKNAEL